MQLETLLEISAAHKSEIRRVSQLTEAALDKFNRNEMNPASMMELEAALQRQADLNAELVRLAHHRGQGFQAGKAGRKKDSCIWPENSLERLYWYKGWCQAQNIMPFTEVTMEQLFDLDRQIRHFNQQFRLVDLEESIARRAYRAAHPGQAWETLDPYLQKLYRVNAVNLLAALMEVPRTDHPALEQPEAMLPPPVPQIGDSGNSG